MRSRPIRRRMLRLNRRKAKDKPKEKAAAKSDAKAKPARGSPQSHSSISARWPKVMIRPGRSATVLTCFRWTRIEQMAFVMTYGFLAIGACLMLGLFTRLSALAGAAFMLFVVLCQPSYPGVYPTDPPQLGHALLVNKDFIEMIALLVIASTSLGRWTGVDFFLSNAAAAAGKGEKA